MLPIAEQIAKEQVDLEIDAALYGSCEIRCNGPSAMIVGSLESQIIPFAQVELVNDNVPSHSFRIPVANFCGATFVNMVPKGSYHARFLASNPSWVWPKDPVGEPLTVGADVACFDVPMTDLGALHLVPDRCLGGDASAGVTVIMKRTQGSPKWARFAFRSLPYVVYGLKAGTYDVTVETQTLNGKVVTNIGGVDVCPPGILRKSFTWSN
jgi:hypothetical protein